MTIDEKRGFLKRYNEFVYISKTWSKQIRELRLSVLPSGVQYSERVSSSLHGDKLAEYMARLDGLAEQYENALEAVFEIRRAIDRLEKSNHRLVLNMRYCERMNIQEIARQMNYSQDHVKRIARQALEAVEIDEDIYDMSKSLRRAKEDR